MSHSTAARSETRPPGTFRPTGSSISAAADLHIVQSTSAPQAHYIAPPPPEPPKTVIAALGPKMLALAAEDADGAHPYNVTPEHTAGARKILGAGKLLCPEQMIL